MHQKLLTHFGQTMHYDFCPWANAYVYWLKRPIGWVAIAFLASLLLGISLSSQAFLVSAAILALGVVGCMWPWIAMVGIRGQLSWSHMRCEEGECIHTTLALVHRWPWPGWGMIVEADDAIASHVEAEGQPICLSRVPPFSKSQLEWVCRPSIRGCYPKRDVRLSTAFPFGIWTSHRKLEVANPLLVWPKTIKLVDVPHQAGSTNAGIGTTSEQIGDEGDWMGVRPYRLGDSLRQVHWAQTSRRDSLVVFERQSRSRQLVSIWFDNFAAANAVHEQREWMIRILASLTNHFLSHSWQVRVHFEDGWTPLYVNQSSKQQWLDKLACWQHNPSQSATDRIPSIREGVGCCLSTASRAVKLSRSISTKDHANLFWLLVDKIEPDESANLFCRSTSAIAINVEKDPAIQLQRQWQQLCQRTSRMKAACRS